MHPQSRTRASLAAAAIATASFANASIEREFAVSAGGRLVVDAEASDVYVSGGAEEVRVAIARRGSRDADILEDFDVDFRHAGDQVEVTVRVRDRSVWRRFWRDRGHLRIEAHVPHEFDASVQTSGGDLRVTRLTGEIDARTSGGDLRFEDVDGPIRGRTSGGDIRLDGTTGLADVETSGGDIDLGDIGGEVQAKTSGGDITVEHAAASVRATTTGGDITIHQAADGVQAKTSGGRVRATLTTLTQASSLTSSGGSLTLHLPERAAFDIDAKTSGGRVTIAEAFAVTTRGTNSKNKVSGTVNGGGPDVHLRTSGGAIRVQTHRR
ncbi:MAG: DUF4097 family beta strand repeat-containing protein [Gammaproteobacteria bacterium]|nr:DUF4097 family beta strand repeat-containing protein [Gammaproteobacteria bacterium]